MLLSGCIWRCSHEVQQKTNALVKDTGIYIQDLNKIPKSFEGTGQVGCLRLTYLAIG